MGSYVTGNAAPPAGIVKNKREFLKDLLEANAGKWVTNDQLKVEAQAHGLGMNQMTARISDLREEYFPQGFGIFSEQTEEHQGAWRYKLDVLTPEYEAMYLKRREEVAKKIKFTADDLLNIKAMAVFVIGKQPIQNDSFWATAAKLGVTNPLTSP